MKIIVFDTNIWLSELALMTPLGCALNYYIANNNFQIGLPEIIELETKSNFKNNLVNYKNDIIKNYNRMLAIFGKMKEIQMPSDEEINSKVDNIFMDHNDRIIRVAFDFNSAKSSLDKIINKEPPNSDKDQQFKDGVIWANCLQLLAKGDVYLITKDAGFYEGKKYENGLANNLKLESNNYSNNIFLFQKVSQLLDNIRTKISVDEETLLKSLEAIILEKVINMIEKRDFKFSGKVSQNYRYYATINPKQLAIKFNLLYELINNFPEERTNAFCESSGEVIIDVDTYEISKFTNRGEKISWNNADGEKIENKNVYVTGNIFLGYKTIEYKEFYELDNI